MARIDGTSETQAHSEPEYFHDEFFRYKRFGIDACSAVALRETTTDKARKISRWDPVGVRRALAYDRNTLGLRVPDEDERQRKQTLQPATKIHPHHAVAPREPTVQVPDVALKVESGWLAGSDRGEFGGELVHIPDQGRARGILGTNVEGIHLIGHTIVAVTGLAHDAINDGTIYRLWTGSGGAWSAARWITLPGAPRSSWLVETGELLINTHSGGSILLSEGGAMRMATCVGT